MPNIFTHNHITAQVYGPERLDLMFASTLLDFLGMYNARHGHKFGTVEIGDNVSSSAKEGIAFHKKTDAAYDRQPEIPEITEPLREALEQAGIAYKAARLTTAFAADILLDRAMLDIDAARSNFDLTRKLAVGDKLPGKEGLDERLTHYIRMYFAAYAPADYRNPENIAIMAQRRLWFRGSDPDKKITRAQIPAVAEVLNEHADRVGELGLRALFGTIQDLGAPAHTANFTSRELEEFSRRVRQATILERAWRTPSQLKDGEIVELRSGE